MDTKIIQNRQISYRPVLSWGLAVLLILASIAWPAVARAATQSYLTTDQSITKGMAVSVASHKDSGAEGQTYVAKSSVSRADKTLGVVVNLGDGLVTSVSGTSQLFVANSGDARVYVTSLNGAVHKGDLLAPSPLEGVLMRANDGTPGILGVALENFSAQPSQTVSVKGGSQIESAKVALIGINMDVKFATSSAGVQQSFLERLGQSVAHHEVSQLQTFIALAVLILLIIVEGGIVYAAISSSLLSIGRNPLAKRAIMGGLLQATGLVIAVLAVGLSAIYLVLRV